MLIETKRRSPGLALVLSLITPGLGQIYNGQLKKGVAFYLMLVILGALLAIVFFGNFYGMLIALAIIIGCFIFIAIKAFYSAKKMGRITLRRYNKWYIYCIIILLPSLVINSSVSATIKNNLFKAYKIPSSGMQPTLHVGDHIMADTGYPGNNEPQREEIIIFKWPVDPSKDFIKRIIGLPGEKIEIIDRQVYINGKVYDDRHGFYSSQVRTGANLVYPCKYCSVTAPDGHYFVLGDNRDNSHDSRFWGFVPLESIKGKALYLYWAKDKSRIGMEIE